MIGIGGGCVGVVVVLLLLLVFCIIETERELHGHDGHLLRWNEHIDRYIKRLLNEAPGIAAIDIFEGADIGQMWNVHALPLRYDW